MERSTGAIFDLDKNPWTAFGTIDQATSMQAMISISAALMVLLMALDIASERRGRYVLVLAVTVSGFITAVAGLCLHTSADLSSLWQVRHVPSSVFGLFWYHGNAAAFLNLVWPVSVWLCVTLLHKESPTFPQQMVLACLVVAVMVQIIAVLVNVSKMGHLMLVLEMLLLVGGGLVAWKARLAELPFSGRRIALLLFIAISLLVLGAWLSGAGTGLGRWNIFAAHHFDDPARRHAAMMAFQIGLDHGWAGTGPGTFEWVAVHYSALDPLLQEGRWRHAHNDYAEFFAEWGWSGAVIFVLVLALPGRRLWSALRHVFSKDSRHGMSFQRKAGLICFSTALFSVLLHAVVDFPLQMESTRYLSAAVAGLVLAMTFSSSRRASRRSA
ncbi:O-antigen ligase family protein [Prosthecobacter sp.]|uniref:O-antigen ligase family protein n=1 Tax=Prosthecobacter sp. TaxID=1965333 RepID=UPI002AC9DC98|nr:O-antigen ligase family protein [Prosthecobacter sp.]